MARQFDEIIQLLEQAVAYYPWKPISHRDPLIQDIVLSLARHPKLSHRWTQSLCSAGASMTVDGSVMAIHLVFDIINGTSTISKIEAALDKFATENEFEILHIYALTGLTLDHPIALSEFARLVPEKSLARGFSKDRLFRKDEAYFDWVKPTAAIEFRGSAYLVDEVSQNANMSGYRQFSEMNKQAEHIRNCLVLSSSASVTFLAKYSVLTEIGELFSGFGGTSYQESSVEPKQLTLVGINRLKSEFASTYSFAPPIQLAINKLSSSRSRRDEAEAFFDLGSALEILLTYRDDGQGKLINRIPKRASVLLAETIDERAAVRDRIRKIYELRNKAAHQGQINDLNSTISRKERQVLRLEAETRIVNLIEILSSGFPSWSESRFG